MTFLFGGHAKACQNRNACFVAHSAWHVTTYKSHVLAMFGFIFLWACIIPAFLGTRELPTPVPANCNQQWWTSPTAAKSHTKRRSQWALLQTWLRSTKAKSSSRSVPPTMPFASWFVVASCPQRTPAWPGARNCKHWSKPGMTRSKNIWQHQKRPKNCLIQRCPKTNAPKKKSPSHGRTRWQVCGHHPIGFHWDSMFGWWPKTNQVGFVCCHGARTLEGSHLPFESWLPNCLCPTQQKLQGHQERIKPQVTIAVVATKREVAAKDCKSHCLA